MISAISVQYELEKIQNWKHYTQKIHGILDPIFKQRPDFVLMPEYAGLDITSLYTDLPEREQMVQSEKNHLADFLELFSSLSRKNDCYICPGTFFVQDGKKFRNRAYIFSPRGTFEFQDKIQLIPMEIEDFNSGTEIKTFETDFGMIGIAICYDSEFPIIVRKQVENGALLILVPSCTVTEEGYYRVQVASRARAMENQCYTLQSSLVGNAPWHMMSSVGMGGAFTPIDSGFPKDGIQKLGKWNEPGPLAVQFNFKALTEVRERGQTRNYQDGFRDHVLTCRIHSCRL